MSEFIKPCVVILAVALEGLLKNKHLLSKLFFWGVCDILERVHLLGKFILFLNVAGVKHKYFVLEGLVFELFFTIDFIGFIVL